MRLAMPLFLVLWIRVLQGQACQRRQACWTGDRFADADGPSHAQLLFMHREMALSTPHLSYSKPASLTTSRTCVGDHCRVQLCWEGSRQPAGNQKAGAIFEKPVGLSARAPLSY